MSSIIICIIIGYVFGSFLTACFVAKKYAGKDISEIGSANPGMANIMCNVGKLPGFIVLAGDIVKTVIAMFLCYFIFRNSLGHEALLWSGFGCLFGHNFPAWRKFKGGKGVTVSCTWIIFYMALDGIVSAVAGGLIVLLTGLLPLGAVMITVFAIPFAYFLYGTIPGILMIISCVVMIYRNFPGFVRGFKNKEERKFKKKRSGWSVVGTILVIFGVVVYFFFKMYGIMYLGSQETGTEDAVEESIVHEAATTEDSVESEGKYDFTLCFAGDINLDENWGTTQYLDGCENGIADCIDPTLIDYMKSAEVMCVNNEFTYSNQGQPLNGKAYTFRARPERVEVLKELGVDVVGMANNHVYDYGNDAMLDTFSTLDGAGIPYFGAGHNLEEAMAPFYVELDGKTVAFVAASRAEKIKMTPQATEESAGILRCYDTELFDQAIHGADANADIVIAVVHWGTEYSEELEEVQKSTAREYIDNGADVVVGAHTHCLQGFEYYNGKPIIYSLGNYWFNEKTLDSMLLNLHFYGDNKEGSLDVEIIPAKQENYITKYVSDTESQTQLFNHLQSISESSVIITPEGLVKENN